MAARHFSIKNGKLGTGAKHAEYVAGIGKYARDDVRHLSDHNLPPWAADGRDFFAAADANERANARAYSEIEFAIPRESSDPVTYARQYAAELLGERHVYRLAVHDKPAADGGRNVHAHLMFSERLLDGVDRSREQFFRRANAKHPERGGAAKDRMWNERQHIDRLRRAHETYAKKHGIALDLRSNEAQGLGPAEVKIGPQKRQNDRWRAEKAANVKTLRQYRRRTHALHDEIEATKNQLRASRRERARQDANTCREADSRAQQRPLRSPLAAMRAETRQGRTVYRWQSGAAAGLAALVDKGDYLTLTGKPSQQKARALAELAKAKGWAGLVLTGSDEFKRHAIREALREGLNVANPELADIVAEEKYKMHQQSRAGLALRWLATAANVDALEAASLKGDPERLQRLFDSNPEAQRWAFIQRQRAEGVPDALLGYHIHRDAAGVTQGVIRHVGSHVWLEPNDRPGHVVAVPLPNHLPPVRPGQRIVVQPNGEFILPDRENTPCPR